MSALVVRLALRETRAAWRHFGFFLVAIALGVGALTVVGLFAANLNTTISREARTLMAADIELRTTRPLSAAGETALRAWQARGVQRTHVSELVAMAAPAEPTTTKRSTSYALRTQLIELKAVEPPYPFYGVLQTEPAAARPLLFGEGERQALVEQTLLVRLALGLGDRIRIGQADFRIAGTLKKEPDRAASLVSFGPRVLISQEGLAATGLIQPGSRVTHRHLLKLPDPLSAVVVQEALATAFSNDAVRIRHYEDAQPMLRRFLDQLGMYLGLVGLLALLVGGIGVAATVRAFLKEKLENIAVLKVLGATPALILQIYLMQAVGLGLLGSVAGVSLGIGVQFAVPVLIRQWLPVEVEFHLALVPVGRALAMGLLTTALFALWPLLEVWRVRPNLIFRREVSEESRFVPEPTAWLVSAALAAALAGLALWQATSWRAALLCLAGLVGGLGLLYGAARGLAWLARKAPRWPSLAWRQGVANLYRPGNQAKTVLVAVGLGVMVILAVHLVEQNLLWEIGEHRPADAPSFFFIDIQPDQHEAFARLLREQEQTEARLTPLVRSRLRALNGQVIRPDMHEQREHGWYFTREYVLTFSQELPPGNEVMKGGWWSAASNNAPASPLPQVSVEEEAARRLGLDLGSLVEFDIQGAQVRGQVSSIRRVDWSNLSTNFYFIFEPGALDGAPMTYVATARVPPAREIPLQRAAVAAFPNVSAINIRDVLDSVARVVDRISLVIRVLAGVSILTGIVVLAGALTATRFQRLYEAMILKVVGATRGSVAWTFAVEYTILGAAAGLIGSLLAAVLAWAVVRWILDVTWLFQPAAIAGGIVATMVLTVAVGFLSTYRILGEKPLPVLRRE